MKVIRTLCLDDQPDDVSRGLKRVERRNKRLRINCRLPSGFDQEKRGLLRHPPDLLVLDLRLDQFGAAAQPPVDYKAQVLAGFARTAMATRKLKDFPIVLWSIREKLNKSYDYDKSSHELFDLVVQKEDIPGAETQIANQWAAIADAYGAIARVPRGSEFWMRLLKVPRAMQLDPRVGEPFLKRLRSFPSHVLARYALNEVVLKNGVLVDERILCARLGIAFSTFSNSRLPDLLKDAEYCGPFGAGWRRWWWSAVEIWWRTQVGGTASILALNAKDRVSQLQQRLGLRSIRVAKPIDRSYGSRFATVCAVLNEPLDPVNGFMLSAEGLQPWQDRQYVCSKVAQKPKFHRLKVPLDPLEAERLRKG